MASVTYGNSLCTVYRLAPTARGPAVNRLAALDGVVPVAGVVASERVHVVPEGVTRLGIVAILPG